MSFDVTLRVGCMLQYEVPGSASLLLNACPQPGGNYQAIADSRTWGENLPIEPVTDEHGNRLSRVCLRRGTNVFRHDALIEVSSKPDNAGLPRLAPCAPEHLPAETLKYTLPSRYCDSDKLANFAWEKFGRVPHGHPRVNAISQWVHQNIEYRYASGRPDLSAWDVLQRGHGVCRDFAHLVVALNRSYNLPARYVTGHLPDVGF